MKFKKASVAYLCLAPALILIALFKVFPIISTILEGFTFNNQWSIQTYKYLFEDPTFWSSLLTTIKFNVVITPVQIIISFLLALLVNVNLKGIGVIRTIFYLPVTISMTVATVLWNMMLNPNNGIINSILVALGGSKQGFFTDVHQALWCIVLVASWIGVGYWMMFILAGLKNVDKSIYESAEIDGANFFRRTVSITIPLIKNSLLFVLVADTSTNFLMFAPMQLITQGGPQNSTNVLMYEAYKSAFQYADRPRSSAIVTILLVIIMLICMVQFRALNGSSEGDAE
ncbi:MAG: sugar ABC transporter permease [Lachnospiraceae bacterium]|nr:sugar ABC transporter permease [Lachnospiraceae bacterium]